MSTLQLVRGQAPARRLPRALRADRGARRGEDVRDASPASSEPSPWGERGVYIANCTDLEGRWLMYAIDARGRRLVERPFAPAHQDTMAAWLWEELERADAVGAAAPQAALRLLP